jgi:endonuclease YncB( thermonuclease family)
MAVFFRPNKITDQAREYESKQNEAKKSKIGIWKDPNFVMPSDFRKQIKTEHNENLGILNVKIGFEK